MTDDQSRRNAQELLAEMLREEQRQTQLIKPISILAQISLILLLIAALLAIVTIAFRVIMNFYQ